MNENDVYVVEEYKFDNPLFTEIDYIIDSCFTDCHKSYFHKIIYEIIYDVKHKKFIDNQKINLTTSINSMNLYELNKKLKVGSQDKIVFNQINKLTRKLLFAFTIYK